MSSLPAIYETFLAGWNEWVSAERRVLFEQAVSPDVEFTDPLHMPAGIEAFPETVAEFQPTRPGAVTIRTSDADLHHDVARYHWAILVGGTRMIDGFDAVQLDADGRFRRISGFFGRLNVS